MRGFHDNLTGGPPSSQSAHRTKQNKNYSTHNKFSCSTFSYRLLHGLTNVNLHVADV